MKKIARRGRGLLTPKIRQNGSTEIAASVAGLKNALTR